MKMSSPKTRCYYYQNDGELDLVYHVPFNRLKAMVKSGKVDESILENYPDGVDIDVAEGSGSQQEMAEYRLVLPFEAKYLLQAAKAVLKTRHGDGYLNAEILERIAKILKRGEHAVIPPSVFEVPMTKGCEPIEVFLKAHRGY